MVQQPLKMIDMIFFPDHECAALKECMSMKTWGFFSKGTKEKYLKIIRTGPGLYIY